MTTTNTQTQAQQNSIDAATNKKTISSECVIFGKAKIQGSCGKITLPKDVTEIKVSGQNVSNTNIKSGELTWFPSKAVVNNKSISTRISSTYSNRVSREFKLHGVTIGGLHLVPISALPELEKALELAKEEYWDKVNHIESNFEAIIEYHKLENPEIGNLIEAYRLTNDQWKGKHYFSIPSPLAVTPYRENDIQEMSISALDSLYEELAEYASSTYKQTFIEQNGSIKSKVSNKSRSPFKKMIAKITNLSFLDKGVLNIVDTLNQIMDAMPLSGYMSPAQYERLARWCLIMSDPKLLKLHSSGNNQEEFLVDEDEDILDSDDPFVNQDQYNADDSTNAFEGFSTVEIETVIEPEFEPEIQTPTQTQNEVKPLSFGNFDW